MITAVATNPVRNSLPLQVSSTTQPQMPAQAATVTLSTAVEGADQETGLFMLL
jgi:hypothetical protein